MRYYLIVFLAWKCMVPTQTKAVNIDSLKNLLTVYPQDTNRVEVLNRLSNAMVRKDASKAQEYAEEALKLAQSLKHLKGQAQGHFQLVYAYVFLGKMEEAMQSADHCISLNQQIGNTEQEADALYLKGYLLVNKGMIEEGRETYQRCKDISIQTNYLEGVGKASKGLGDIFETQGEYNTALENYRQNLQHSLEQGNNNGIIGSYNDIGRIVETQGNFDEALNNYIKGLELAEQIENYSYSAALTANIASLYTAQKNYEKALEYTYKALGINQKLGKRGGIAHIYQDLGVIFRRQQQYDTALVHFEKALEIRREIGDKRGLSFTYFSLGDIYVEKKSFNKALNFHKVSLKLREELGLKNGISSSNKAIGELYIKQGRYSQAYPYLKKALDMAEDIGAIKDVQGAQAAMVRYYAKTGDFQNAYRQQKMYQETRDSIFSTDQNQQIARMQTRYETEKKERQILEQENSILTLENEKGAIEKQRNYLFGGGLFLAVLGFFGFQLHKTRRDRNDKIAFAQALMSGQEEERKRIARDLHDGVGQSLLLIQKQLTDNYENTLENQEMVAETLEEVRSISQDLHPFQLEKFGITSSIQEAVLKVEKASDVFITSEIENIDAFISSKDAIHVYRTVQEALSNIVKHSGATAAKITAKTEEDTVKILIQDNGQGFDHELKIATSNSLGLRTMYERIAAIGGKLTIQPGAQKGTEVEIEVPVEG